LAGLLQEKYGYAKAKAEQEIDQFSSAIKALNDDHEGAGGEMIPPAIRHSWRPEHGALSGMR
jgi:hypothetical protein